MSLSWCLDKVAALPPLSPLPLRSSAQQRRRQPPPAVSVEQSRRKRDRKSLPLPPKKGRLRLILGRFFSSPSKYQPPAPGSALPKHECHSPLCVCEAKLLLPVNATMRAPNPALATFFCITVPVLAVDFGLVYPHAFLCHFKGQKVVV